VRARVGETIRRALGATVADLAEYADGAGDRGLFGPDSPVWVVHADLPSMLIGGFAALMTQTLHPLAMAGVADHSNYREDPTGRLRRTARFIAGTTFGATPFAYALVAEVARVHERVHGIAPDGRPYAASDPELLTFVHVSEVGSFLASYQRYGKRPLLRVEKDRYLDEVAVIGELLGAKGVPRSVAALRAYRRSVLPELARTDQAAEALAFLARPASDTVADLVGHRVLIAAAIDLLPPELQSMVVGHELTVAARAATRAAGGAFVATVRWAVGPSIVRSIALERIAAG